MMRFTSSRIGVSFCQLRTESHFSNPFLTLTLQEFVSVPVFPNRYDAAHQRTLTPSTTRYPILLFGHANQMWGVCYFLRSVLVKSCCQYRNRHRPIRNLVIDQCAKDDVGVLVYVVVNDLRGPVNLLQTQSVSPNDVEHNSRSLVNGSVEEGTGDGGDGRVLRGRLAGTSADAHEGGSHPA